MSQQHRFTGMGIKAASEWAYSSGCWQFMQRSNPMVRTQWHSSLTRRNLVLSLLALCWLFTSPLSLTLLLVQPLWLHGLSLYPSGWPSSPSFSGSVLVGPHSGSLIASGWSSYDGPVVKIPTPQAPRFQTLYPYEALSVLSIFLCVSPFYSCDPRTLPPFVPRSCWWVDLATICIQMC